MRIAKQRKPIKKKGYILNNSNYITFWKNKIIRIVKKNQWFSGFGEGVGKEQIGGAQGTLKAMEPFHVIL